MGRSRSFNIEMSRLVASAVVNHKFRQTLLTNLAQALRGYGSEKFYFTPAERVQILSIRAATLEEFADQALRLIDGTDSKSSISATPSHLQ